ncbi:MAG: DUF3303 family protein [Streptomyces sp.]|uniref:DUF3303 family protein n=1 Tax=Streptomyces sp. TaxID=1931 RepID=UPI003D6B26DB
MRMMMRVLLDTKVSNDGLKSGKLPKLMETVLDQLKPEAAYFTPHGGRRSCVLVFDMQDSSLLPTITEPFLQEMGAEIEIQPVMNREELKKGLAALR